MWNSDPRGLNWCWGTEKHCCIHTCIHRPHLHLPFGGSHLHVIWNFSDACVFVRCYPTFLTLPFKILSDPPTLRLFVEMNPTVCQEWKKKSPIIRDDFAVIAFKWTVQESQPLDLRSHNQCSSAKAFSNSYSETSRETLVLPSNMFLFYGLWLHLLLSSHGFWHAALWSAVMLLTKTSPLHSIRVSGRNKT